MSKITEKWVFDLNFSEAHKPKLDLLEGKIFFTRNSEASLATLMKKAPFQFILMLTFPVPV